MTDLLVGGLILAVVLVLVCVVMNNFFHAKYASLISSAQSAERTDLSAMEARLSALIHGATSSAPAPVSHSVTQTFGGSPSSPAGTITDPPAPTPTVNGVPVPSGMTYETFNQLVTATMGAASMLANTALHASLLDSSQAWWNSLGAYFREELLKQGTADTTIAFSALGQAGPALIPITPDQQAAANQSAGVAAGTV